MSDASKRKVGRRALLKGAALAASAGALGVGGCSFWPGGTSRASRAVGKKVIVIGIDGMDPRLAEAMMQEGLLPNLQRLRAAGGFSPLGTSVPPQSPVAWANFINGAGPGTHGIFDFIHRHPHKPTDLFYSAAETIPGEGTVLRRQGTPFWDFLDDAGVPTTFYDLPCNYPPSPSKHGHHRCIAGMGTPDMLGGYGTYQHFTEDGPNDTLADAGGRPSLLNFEAETARASLVGPNAGANGEPILTEFFIHRDRDAKAVVIEIQGKRILLREGEWSRWNKIEFDVFPWYTFSSNPSGICRFYVQEVAPNCKIYVTPINIDPANPAVKLSEPDNFIKEVSAELGPFYTTGFQEDYEARKRGIFSDDEFIRQADYVLRERLTLFDRAIKDYEDGLLFFYFSSSDLQSHILWWNSDAEHPIRPPDEARARFQHVRRLYQRLDHEIGEKIINRYGNEATIIVMSDHGFANFGRQFNLNTWLRANGYLGSPECTSIMHDVNWSQTAAYGLGLNGLYLNLKGREPGGIIEPGPQRDALLDQLIAGLEAVVDENGQRVIRGVYRADRIYSGGATALAPDLVVGYARGYRASWATVQGDLTDEILLDNDSAWSADHCADALEVPGVLFTNRPIRSANPSLIDVAPAILAEFGVSAPSTMVGRSIFAG